MKTDLIKKALEREERPMTEYIENQVFNSIYEYFSNRYGILARKTIPHFITSLILRKVNINNDLLRTRKHIMLAWGPGWVKSTLLNHMMSVTPYDIDYHYTSGVTKASFRGSVVRDANISEEEQEQATRPDIQQGFIFHAPMIASYDLIGISDFSNLVNNNVLMNKFLSILEEGQVSIGMTTVSLLRKIEGWLYEKWGIRIEKNRDMTYETNVTFWSAVHDVTKIPEDSREALLGRFRVIRVPERYLNRGLLRKILRGGTLRDEDREGQYQEQLDELIEGVSEDRLDGERYHNQAVEIIEGLIDEEPALFNVHTLRDTDKLMKDAIALLAIDEPSASVEEFLREEVYNIYLEKTNPSQLLHSLLLEDRYTLDALSETTGLSKRRIQYLIENAVPGVRREERHGIAQYTCQ